MAGPMLPGGVYCGIVPPAVPVPRMVAVPWRELPPVLNDPRLLAEVPPNALPDPPRPPSGPLLPVVEFAKSGLPNGVLLELEVPLALVVIVPCASGLT